MLQGQEQGDGQLKHLLKVPHHQMSQKKRFKNNIHDFLCLLDLTSDLKELEQAKSGIIVSINGQVIKPNQTTLVSVANNACVVKISLSPDFPASIRNQIIQNILESKNRTQENIPRPVHVVHIEKFMAAVLRVVSRFMSFSFTFTYHLNSYETELLLADILVAHKLPIWFDNGYQWKAVWHPWCDIEFIIDDKKIEQQQ